MTDRIPMRSKSLQEKFAEVYQELFSRSLIVCSVSRLFYWTGEYSECYGGPYLLHKLPIRTYVGLEPIARNKIGIGYYKVYDPTKQQFRDVLFDHDTEKYMVDFIVKYLQRNNLRTNQQNGFFINIVAELPFEAGLSGTSGFASALVTAIFLHYKLITPQEIKNWSKYSVDELISNPQLKFSQIHKLSWKLELIVTNHMGSGGQSFATLLPSANPVLYFTEQRSGSAKHHPLTRAPHDLGNDYDLVDQIKYWAFRPEELIKPQENSSCPIDYGLIFTGDLRITSNVAQSILAKKTHLDETAGFVAEKFSKVAGDIEPFFYTLCKDKKGTGLWQRYTEMAAAISLQIIHRFKKIYDFGASEEEMLQFFRAINYYQNLLRIYNISTPTIDYIIAYIREKVQSISDFPRHIAIKIVGAGRGGDILFAVPYGTLRNEIDEIIEHLRLKTKKNIFLDYASWLDGG